MSSKQVWSWHLAAGVSSSFLSITWHGEALYGLGIQGVKALILLGAFFLPSVTPASQKDF
jgi:asparagine N-glycosylation enzyme membrane subunit Stt3